MLATVTDNGQVTLPKAIRDLLNLRLRLRIDFQVTADKKLTAQVQTRSSEGLFGLLYRPSQKHALSKTWTMPSLLRLLSAVRPRDKL